MKNIRTIEKLILWGGLVAMLGAPIVMATDAVTNGLVFWVKADTGVHTNADGVYQWDDQSGLGNHATQTVAAAEPHYVSNVTGPTLRKPVLRFSGTNCLGFLLPNADAYSGMTFIFVTSRMNYPEFADGSVIGSGVNGTPGIRWAMQATYTPTYGLGWGGAASEVDLGSGAGLASDTFYAQSYVKTKSGGWTIASGLSAISGATTTTVTDTSFPTGTFQGWLGAERPEPITFPLRGDIAEVLIYSNALTSADAEQTRAYLAEKYWIGTTPDDWLVFRGRADLGVHTNANGVHLWEDQSGWGNHATQSVVELEPKLVPNIAGIPPRMPVLRFDGISSSNCMTFTLANASAFSGMTFVYVASRSSARSYEMALGSGAYGALATPGIRWALGMGSAADQGLGCAGTAGLLNLGSGAGLANNTFYLQSYVKTKGTGSGWSINSGQSRNTTGTVTTVADESFPSGTFNGVIGTENSLSPGTYAFSGDVAELRIYRAALTDAQLQTVREELWQRYLKAIPQGSVFGFR